jgi:hypothetical protein
MRRLQASQKQNKVLAFEADSLLAQVAVLNTKNQECAAVIEQKNSDIEAQIAAAEGLSASLKSKERLSGSSADRARQLAAELEQAARKSAGFERQLAALQAQLDAAEREHSEHLASRASEPASFPNGSWLLPTSRWLTNASCFALRASCFVLRASRFVLCASCFVLRASRFALCASRFALRTLRVVLWWYCGGHVKPQLLPSPAGWVAVLVARRQCRNTRQMRELSVLFGDGVRLWFKTPT